MSPQPQPTKQQQLRINLSDLKGYIVKRIGPDRAIRYFGCLSRFLNRNLDKAEFDKLCYLTLGRDNIVLHNRLIRSVLWNACGARAPPPIPKRASKSIGTVGKKSPPKDDGLPSIGEISSSTSNSLPNSWNGDTFPLSPCKFPSEICDQRSKDSQSEALILNESAYSSSHQSSSADAAFRNGDAYTYDLQSLVRQDQILEQPAGKLGASLLPSSERPHTRGLGELALVKDREELVQRNSANSTKIALQAPIGISFLGRRTLPGTSRSVHVDSYIDSGQLSDSETLRRRMEQIAGSLGLSEVSIDCANLLNNGLDVYMKRLIKSCIGLVGPRSGIQPIKNTLDKQHSWVRLTNGVTRGYQMHLECSNGIMEAEQEPKSRCLVSLLDFRAAMELNSWQLGNEWPGLLEKIGLHLYAREE